MEISVCFTDHYYTEEKKESKKKGFNERHYDIKFSNPIGHYRKMYEILWNLYHSTLRITVLSLVLCIACVETFYQDFISLLKP